MTIPNNHITIETNGLKPGERASEDISDLVVSALDHDQIWADFREKDMLGYISCIGKSKSADDGEDSK